MSVDAAWDRIQQWLANNARATAGQIQQPADSATLAAAEAAFPLPWPDDLRAWYQLQNGEREEEPLGGMLMEWTVLPLDEMLFETDMYSDFPDDVDDLEPAPYAGDNAFVFRPEFVPIGSDRAGDTLFVDLRPGARSGCVTGFFKGDADTGGPIWSSVAAMLDDVAGSLEDTRPCDGWVPVVIDGALTWELEAGM